MVIRARREAGESWLSLGGKKGRKQLIVIEGAQQVAHVKIGIAFGAGRMGDPGSFLGNRANRVGVQRHRLSPTKDLSRQRPLGREIVSLLSPPIRQHYHGRAGFALLRQRVLHVA